MKALSNITASLLLGMTLAIPAQAEIYRSVDAEGNVIFSDVPMENAEKVEIREPTTYKALPYKSIQPATKKTPDERQIRYRLDIVAPKEKETILDNQGNLPVDVTLQPALHLKAGHRLRIVLDDGKPVFTTTTPYVLRNVYRGTHTLRVHVVDAQGKPLSPEQRVTVFMRRHSRLFKPHALPVPPAKPKPVPPSP